MWCSSIESLCCLGDGSLEIVGADVWRPTRTVQADGDPAYSFAVNLSGTQACMAHRSGLLRHWLLDLDVPKLANSWKAHEQPVVDLCFDMSSVLVASGSIDRTVKVWDVARQHCTHSFKGHSHMVSIVRFHPVKLQLVSVSDLEVRLWDLKSSSCLGVIKGHLASVSSVCFACIDSNKFYLVTGGRDQMVGIWQLKAECPKVNLFAIYESVEGVAAVSRTSFDKISVPFCQLSQKVCFLVG